MRKSGGARPFDLATVHLVHIRHDLVDIGLQLRPVEGFNPDVAVIDIDCLRLNGLERRIVNLDRSIFVVDVEEARHFSGEEAEKFLEEADGCFFIGLNVGNVAVEGLLRDLRVLVMHDDSDFLTWWW